MNALNEYDLRLLHKTIDDKGHSFDYMTFEEKSKIMTDFAELVFAKHGIAQLEQWFKYLSLVCKKYNCIEAIPELKKLKENAFKDYSFENLTSLGQIKRPTIIPIKQDQNANKTASAWVYVVGIFKNRDTHINAAGGLIATFLVLLLSGTWALISLPSFKAFFSGLWNMICKFFGLN
jgi:hypothetical protein